MQFLKKCIGGLILVFMSSACLTRSVGLVPSSRPVFDGAVGTRPVHGTSCQYYLLGLLPISSPLSTQMALREAKDMGGVEVLTDITIDEMTSYYLLFSSHCVYVEGLGVIPGKKKTPGAPRR